MLSSYIVYYNWSSLSRGHQIVTIMNHCYYCFDVLCEGQIDIIVLLNAVTKLQNMRGASRHPVLMGKCPTCSHMP